MVCGRCEEKVSERKFEKFGNSREAVPTLPLHHDRECVTYGSYICDLVSEILRVRDGSRELSSL